jgi:hypothetical protein
MTMADWIFIALAVLFVVALLSRYMMVLDRRRHSRRRGFSDEFDVEQTGYDRRFGIERRRTVPVDGHHAVVRDEEVSQAKEAGELETG